MNDQGKNLRWSQDGVAPEVKKPIKDRDFYSLIFFFISCVGKMF